MEMAPCHSPWAQEIGDFVEKMAPKQPDGSWPRAEFEARNFPADFMKVNTDHAARISGTENRALRMGRSTRRRCTSGPQGCWSSSR